MALRSLPPTWETWVGFLASSFSTAQPQHLCTLGEWTNRQELPRSLSLPRKCFFQKLAFHMSFCSDNLAISPLRSEACFVLFVCLLVPWVEHEWIWHTARMTFRRGVLTKPFSKPSNRAATSASHMGKPRAGILVDSGNTYTLWVIPCEGGASRWCHPCC